MSSLSLLETLIGTLYATFITPQCKKLLKEYLRVREEGVRRQPEELTPESPLIAINRKPVKPRSISELWVAMVDRAGNMRGVRHR